MSVCHRTRPADARCRTGSDQLGSPGTGTHAAQYAEFHRTLCIAERANGRLLKAYLTDDGSPTCYSLRYGQSYHSRHGAVTEARHVFLHGSGVADRLERHESVELLEIGFGLGLNCLITADFARSQQARLRYHATEWDLPTRETLLALDYGRWLQHPELADALREVLHDPACRDNTRTAPVERRLDPYTVFFLYTGDATTRVWPQQQFHAIYLDAFSADVNPECWRGEFLARIVPALRPDGVLVSYSVRGSLCRALEDLGMNVEKTPGPPGKREMLRARPHPL